MIPHRRLLGFYLFGRPTPPYRLYQLAWGVHVTLDVVLAPVLPAKRCWHCGSRDVGWCWRSGDNEFPVRVRTGVGL
ncbi:hypothetical protein [Streptantibioticus ferralitis]|uniref:Uncharacterized protein n=1 Tax=Streptantibioticus ferralitis TaxID=236510 RepID=A0ABT5ZAC9_9ACTN|nr:hypothetical protein [Streptantibioticus ferralitis]